MTKIGEDPLSVVKILSVSPSDAHQARIREMVRHSNWRLAQVRNCAEALRFLGSNVIPVVIVDRTLPDGDWSLLVRKISLLPRSPVVIVACERPEDSFWRHALRFGAYDVLEKPIQPKELARLVILAWRHWKETSQDTDLPVPA